MAGRFGNGKARGIFVYFCDTGPVACHADVARRQMQNIGTAMSVPNTTRFTVFGSSATREQIQFIQGFWSTILFPRKVDDLSSMQIAEYTNAKAI
jgi:hypothetical protein